MAFFKLDLDNVESEMGCLMMEYSKIKGIETKILEIEQDGEGDEYDYDICYVSENKAQPTAEKTDYMSISLQHKDYDLENNVFYGFFEVVSNTICDVFKVDEFEEFCIIQTRPNSKMAKYLLEKN